MFSPLNERDRENKMREMISRRRWLEVAEGFISGKTKDGRR